MVKIDFSRMWCAPALMLMWAVSACQPQLLKQAEYYERNGQFDKAEIALRRHLESHPGNADAHFWLAQIYGVRQHDDKMTASLEEAVRYDGRLRDAALHLKEKFWRERYNAGVRFLRQEDHARAVTSLGAATRILPDRVAAYPPLGAALLAVPDSGDALPVFETAVRLRPEDLSSWQALQLLYFQRGKLDRALQASAAILKQWPGELAALRCRALSLERLSEVTPGDSLLHLAEAALQNLVRASASPEDLTALGVHYYRRGDYRRAMLQFDAAYASAPENKEVMRYLGDCAWQLGDYAGMSHWYGELLRQEPNSVELLQNLLIAEQALGRAAEVEKLRTRLDRLQGR